MKYIPIKDAPPALLELLTDGHPSIPTRYGVTSLIGAPMQRQLLIRHYNNLVVDPLDNMFMLFGRLLHEKLEKKAGQNALTEERLTLPLPDGKCIVGIPDYYDEADGGTIWDYKFCSTFAGKDDEVKPEWVQQLNIYAYLLKKCAGFDAKHLKIAMIFRDWSAAKARTQTDYPPKFKVVSVGVYPLSTMETFINHRLAEHARAEKMTDDELATLMPCTDDERWMSEQVFAVMKDGAKKATKLFVDKSIAESHAEELGKAYAVVERPKVYRKCEEYCNLRQVCPIMMAKKDPTTNW